MTSSTAPIAGTPAADTETAADWPAGAIVRDIARGGVAGLVVGVVLAGIGGRLVMRMAALAVPSAVGSVTENGNRIGEITLAGTLGLVFGIGLVFGAVAGTLWVTASPWIPGPPIVRGILAIPLAVALGAFGLIRAGNPDFVVLRHDPLVIGALVLLVALFGPMLALTDAWLDRRLPHRPTRGGNRAYLAVTVTGLAIALLLVLPMFLGSALWLTGLAMVATGFATLAWWNLRARGRSSLPPGLLIVGRAGLLAATVVGLAVAVPEITGALRLG